MALERARRGEELALVETMLGNNKLVITGVCNGMTIREYHGVAGRYACKGPRVQCL
jgi:hypothetical protein